MLHRRSVLAALFVGAVFVGMAPQAHSQTQANGQTSEPTAPAVVYEERSIGSKDAPVTVYEYSSLQCGHCATFHADVLPKLKAAYIDTGKVRWVFRDHSLGHPWSLAGAMIVRCAPADADYKLRNTLMANARSWGQAENPLKLLKAYVALAGVSGDDVDACLKNRDVLDGIKRFEKAANDMGIDSTPSFVIQGLDKPVVGFQTYDQFKAILDPLLAKSR